LALAGVLLVALLLALTRRTPGEKGQLSPEERARLLADVKATLERGRNPNAPGVAL